MKSLVYLSLTAIIISCATKRGAVKAASTGNRTLLLTEVSTDPTYGSEKNPIEVGGVDKGEGPLNQRRFLNALAGPNGERVSYYRAGSCCPVRSEKGPMGMAMLDNYRVTWEGSKDTTSLYMNMYDYGELKAPVGFTIRK